MHEQVLASCVRCPQPPFPRGQDRLKLMVQTLQGLFLLGVRFTKEVNRPGGSGSLEYLLSSRLIMPSLLFSAGLSVVSYRTCCGWPATPIHWPLVLCGPGVAFTPRAAPFLGLLDPSSSLTGSPLARVVVVAKPAICEMQYEWYPNFRLLFASTAWKVLHSHAYSASARLACSCVGLCGCSALSVRLHPAFARNAKGMCNLWSPGGIRAGSFLLMGTSPPSCGRYRLF